MPDHSYFANLIWQIADLLRGPYRPPQYERVMLPMTVLRRFDCVLAPTKSKVLTEYRRRKGRLRGEALDRRLNTVAGQRFHNHSELDFEKLQHMVHKFEPVRPAERRYGSRLAIVFSGSPLFAGGAGSGESKPRSCVCSER